MKRIEMIGTPLGHVQTPGLLSRMLLEERRNISVRLQEVDENRLSAYVAAARRNSDILGLVVTSPLKEAICNHLNHRTKLVALVGSANCVRCGGRSWIGANFDGLGLLVALARAGIAPSGRSILLKGYGGAGRAIAAALALEGAKKLVVSDPKWQEMPASLRRLEARVPGCSISFGMPDTVCDIIINASPLGLHAEDPSPVAPHLVAQCDCVVDITIGPGESHLLRCGREYHKRVIDGSAMVRGQVGLLHDFLLGEVEEQEASILAAGKTGQESLL